MSFAQQRLWFIDQLGSNSALYNIPQAVRLRGRLHIEALQRTLEAIAARHETLRTTFTSVDGSPMQVIAERRPLALSMIDLRAWPEVAREAAAQGVIREEAERPFDLACDMLLRATLLRLDPEEHVLLLTMHHIVSDGWSMEVLFRELATLYGAFSTGKPSPLPPLPIQYRDYAGWQRQWLRGEVLEAQVAYWKRQLAGAPAILELPTDRPRPPVQTYRGTRQSWGFPEDLSAALHDLSRQEGATLFMVLLAAFQTLLHRCTGQEDVVVGSPIAGRSRPELEGLIGFFVNTLPLRTDLSGNPTFRELLGRVREVALGAYAHQELPFGKLVEELRPEQDLSHSPLFQAILTLQNAPRQTVALPGLTLTLLEVDTGTAEFDLTLSMIDEAAGLRGWLEYNTALFEAATIRCLVSQFQTLLAGIVAHPSQRLAELPLLTEAERHWLSAQRNSVCPTNAFVAFPREAIEQSIPARFEQQVEAYPQHTAVKTKRYEWTYEELNRVANRVAHTLLTLHGVKDERIGLIFEHDAPMIASILGVLKAGKTYVPLDPSYPKERLAYMLEDAQAGAILTDRRSLAFANALANDALPLVDVDEIEPAARLGDIDLPISPDALAYILYTSGSTGQPKGVMQNHRNVLHFMRVYTNNLHISPDDRLTLISSYGFDAAVMDIFGALLNGATLHPAPIHEKGLATLSAWLTEHQITVYHSTPTVYRYFVSALTGAEAFPSIRLLVLGGEAVYKSDVDAYKRHFSPDCILVNGLGPTESTVTLQYFLDKQTEITRHAAPIGYPVEDTEIILRNAAGGRVDVYGEITVRSPHIALGYWRKPEVTQRVFMPDPERGSRRIYCTGDMGRLLPDGRLEFVGRKDYQVKIWGFRVEPAEIEAVLGQHPAVREAVVVAREDGPGNTRLVTYLVAAERAPTAQDLRTFLQQRLPAYMVPSSFVILDALPLTPTGKVDRQALPPPDQARPELEKSYIAPRTELERFLTNMWQEILGIENIGIHDKFFDLGGNSIQGAIFINKLQKELGEIIYVVALFDAPCIAEFATYLSQYYSDAVSKICKTESLQTIKPGRDQIEKINSFKVTWMRQLIHPLPPREERHEILVSKNPPAIFSLSPPRSGSTLFRVMLAGHPLLFAPQELELLSFNTLGERKAALSGRESFRLEGTIRAVMEIKGCDAEQAKRIMEHCENQELTTQQFYGFMQAWIGEKILVDKTPSYALDLETLKRAEMDFDDTRYIHLLRHPYGMIRSFEEAKLDQVFFSYEHPFSVRELAELIWLISHQNILEFLKHIPNSRQYRVRFEDLVNQPRSTLERICQFLGLEFHYDMLQPYKDQERKMTDGIYAVSKMRGDVKFHEHKDIDSGVGNRWEKYYTEDFLADITWQLAESLGYENLTKRKASYVNITKRMNQGDAERLIAKLDQLSDKEVDSLLCDLLTEEGLNG